MKLTLIFLLFLCLTGSKSFLEREVVLYGSSTLSYIAPFLKEELMQENIRLINNAQSGQVLETMEAHQGLNPISILILSKKNDFLYNISIRQNRKIGKLSPIGIYKAKIIGIGYGTIDLNKKTVTFGEENNRVEVNRFYKVDFGFEKYASNAINLFCVGKNNLVIGEYSAEQVFKEVNRMVDFIRYRGNNKYIVCGNFVDKDLRASQEILKLNSMMKKAYKNKYLDMQEVIKSPKIWDEIGIKPSTKDLYFQNIGALPPSLARNKNHLNERMDIYFSKKISQKIKDLKY